MKWTLWLSVLGYMDKWKVRNDDTIPHFFVFTKINNILWFVLASRMWRFLVPFREVDVGEASEPYRWAREAFPTLPLTWKNWCPKNDWFTNEICYWFRFFEGVTLGSESSTATSFSYVNILCFWTIFPFDMQSFLFFRTKWRFSYEICPRSLISSHCKAFLIVLTSYSISFSPSIVFSLRMFNSY